MREKGLTWELLGQHLLLLPQKALYWEEEKTLVLADLHIGKVGHFRKAGIAIPKVMEQEELSVLSDLINELKPEKLIFLGDLFHSEMNNDWNWFQLWCELFPSLKIILVKGNHDILHEDHYLACGFEMADHIYAGPFLFTHEPLPEKRLPAEKYVISGHLHPGVKLRGAARQSVILSCFHFGPAQAVLPAFGKFTGKFCLASAEQSAVFGILDKKVIRL